MRRKSIRSIGEWRGWEGWRWVMVKNDHRSADGGHSGEWGAEGAPDGSIGGGYDDDRGFR